jgi:hypothetical protein
LPDAAGEECEMQLCFCIRQNVLRVVPTGHKTAIDRYLARIKQPFSNG